jgi:SAM-dependent methyltransferase
LYSSDNRHVIVRIRALFVSKNVVMSAQTEQQKRPHDWREAGDAWGHAANEWACLYEHYSADVIIAIFDRVGVRADTSVLDLACGSGMAMYRASSIGAVVSGIDASEELVAIARSRNPTADVRVGSMFALPWGAGVFDAVVSINGIWGGCGAALDEANRALRSGGRIGISFWGSARPLDLRECFKAYARHAPDEHFGSMKALNTSAHPASPRRCLLRADSRSSSVDSGCRSSNGLTPKSHGEHCLVSVRQFPRYATATLMPSNEMFSPRSIRAATNAAFIDSAMTTNS